MFAVFLMSEHAEVPGVPDQSVTIFDTKENAEAFVLAKLIEAGEIELLPGGIFQTEHGCFESAEDAVDGWQENTDTLEFFHVYPAVMHAAV